jgi:hypothetical protein
MTYTFKLSRRLAASRSTALLALVVAVAACDSETTAPSTVNSSASIVSTLSVLPRRVTAEVNQPIQFRAVQQDPRGRERRTQTVWSSTGGVVTTDGTFSSSVAGTFKVIGHGRGWRHADTAVVNVVPPDSVARLDLSPATVSLDTNARRAFSATAYGPDGSTVTVGLTWSATGGTIDADGGYTAGAAPGTYRVIVANTAGSVADTSIVTISAAAAAPAPDPAPTLAAVYVLPASATLATGASQQFKAYGKNSAGDSVPVAVSFAATGGTITSAGLYTAGGTGGGFRVIAKDASTGKADTSAVTLNASAPPPPSSSATGIPFGPFGLWASATTLEAGAGPFTTSQNSTDPGTIVTQISAARTMKQTLVLAMTGGAHSNYLTNGAFDLSKWKARMDRFNTSAIRNAVAQGVSDGTIVGNSLMDEPEFKDWGGVVTKSMLDQMASYAKGYFPSLPMGVNHGPGGYRWRATERYRVVDYTVNQYAWVGSKGDLSTWRTAVLSQAALDGVTPAFSLNLLNGGTQDTDGTWDCTGTGGLGTRAPNCRMTASQLDNWGSGLVTSGCALLMWRYDDAFVARTDNKQSFADIAARAASLASQSCRRGA